MDDFEERFGEIFRRVVDWSWGKKTEVKTTLVGKCYPIDEDTGKVKHVPDDKEHPRWAQCDYVVVEVMYPSDYPKEQRELGFAGDLPKLAMASLVAIGLGPLLHNGDGYEDRFVIWAPKTVEIYRRLPPLGQECCDLPQ